MSRSPFMAFAEAHDLDYCERVSPAAAGRFPLPHGDVTELVGARLPDGRECLMARLRRETEGSEAPTESTLVVTRIPESVDFARFITCFEAGFRGIASRAIGPGGLGWIREYPFESIEFNRRYRVAMLRTGKESRLRQLFAPTFLDWMAETAPEGLYFDLVSGVLTVTLAAGATSEAPDLERACELAGHIAERIRSEALEGTLDGAADPEAKAAYAAAEARYAAQIERAGFSTPPADVASALERIGPVIEDEKGLLRRLIGSKDSVEARMVALVTVLRAYGDRAGLVPQQPEALHEVLPFLDHFPMAVLRMLSLRGTLPSTAVPGSVVALADLTSMGSGGGLSSRPAVEVAPGEDCAFVHILPRDDGAAAPRSVIGGFSIALGDGGRRETEATRGEREAASALSESLGGRFDVVAHHWPGSAPLGPAAQDWLASGAGDALVLEGGRLTLVGAARPVREWSFATLEEFCTSVTPVIAEWST